MSLFREKATLISRAELSAILVVLLLQKIPRKVTWKKGMDSGLKETTRSLTGMVSWESTTMVTLEM